MMTWLFANGGILASYGHYAGPQGVNNTPAASWSVTGPPSKAVIACSYLFVASYAPTWGPVSWIYPPELYPLRVRGKAVALATSANWAFNFALGYFVPPAFVNIKWQTYILFGVFCAAMFVSTVCLFLSKGSTADRRSTRSMSSSCSPKPQERHLKKSRSCFSIHPDQDTLVLLHGRPRYPPRERWRLSMETSIRKS